MQRCGYMGERRAEKPNRDDEATHTPAAAGSNYDHHACRDKEKEGCAWCAGAQRLGLLEGSGKRERQCPVGAGATRGLRHSWSGQGGRVGRGENSLTSLLVRPSALVHWLNPARSRAQGSLETKTRGCRREKGTEEDGPPAHQRP